MTSVDTTDIDMATLDLGSGTGSAATVAALAGQALHGRWILLQVLVATLGADRPDEAGEAESALRVLADLRDSDPDLAADLLAYPHLGNWLTLIFRWLNFADHAAAQAVPMWADLGYLRWMAASGEILAGRPGSARVVVRAGVVMLPLLGMARLNETGECGHCRLSWSADGVLRFDDGATTRVVHSRLQRPQPAWSPLRRLEIADSAHPIHLDDLDPFRDLDVVLPEQFTPESGELDPADALSWARYFDLAWQLLRSDFPQYYAPMRASLRMVVPLTGKPEKVGQSWTSPTGFGAIYATAPADVCNLTNTLIHEFQHNKFSLLVDQAQLFEPDATARFYAPWRVDPRPIYGIMHGIYAFFGVTDFWRVHRKAACHRNMRADLEFECGRRQIATAIHEVVASGFLAPDGEKFLARLADRIAPWQSEDISPQVRDVAADVSVCLRAFWRVRNLAMSPADTAGLADLAAHGSPVADIAQPRFADQASIPASYHRLTLPHAMMRHAAEPDPLRDRDDGSGDFACITGDLTLAAERYQRQLRDDPMRPQTWAGLASALPRLHAAADLSLLRERTELVAAAYAALAERGIGCDVVDLVQRLSPAAGSPSEPGAS
ncbi:MAG: hypothetical protein HOQ24_07320 [Mycobacteriaceae bacterium]|nr:hypothetical protein [Mycobacteriaceae bacterium]